MRDLPEISCVRRSPPRLLGLTVIELLISLAVIAILTATAVPAFSNLILDARMTTGVNRIVHGVHVANLAAHQTLRPTALCKTMDGRQCSDSAGWRDGWIVFINDDADDPPRIDAGERVLDVGRGLKTGTVTGNRKAFVFRPFETRSTNGTLTFCDRRGAARARSVVISYTGRPRVAVASTGCPSS